MAELAGALLALFIFSRIVRWLLFKKAVGLKRVLGPNIIVLIAATVVGAFGMADGGPPRFYEAFLSYVIPFVILVAMDAILLKTYYSRTNAGSAATLEPRD